MTLSIDVAEKLLTTYDCSVHIKELNSGKYVASNSPNLKVFGMNAADDIIGLTLRDMHSFMKPFWGNTAKEVQNYDDMVLVKEQLVEDHNRAWLNARGLLWHHKMLKHPVVNNKGVVSYVLTISQTVDCKIGYKALYKQYQKFYKDYNICMLKFLEHVNLIAFFNPITLPTEKQLDIIMLKANYYLNKQIAYALNVSTRAIDYHINEINRKLITPFTLENLLRMLETQYRGIIK